MTINNNARVAISHSTVCRVTMLTLEFVQCLKFKRQTKMGMQVMGNCWT